MVSYTNKIRDKQLIEKVQRRRLKTVVILTNASYEDRLAVLKLPTSTSRRIFNDLVYTFKTLNHKLSVDVATIVVLADVSHFRGHSKKLFHEKYKTK